MLVGVARAVPVAVVVGGAGSVVVVEVEPLLRLLDPPKNVVRWPLPVIERPVTASDTV